MKFPICILSCCLIAMTIACGDEDNANNGGDDSNSTVASNTTASNTTASNTTASNTMASNTTASNTTASNTTASNTTASNTTDTTSVIESGCLIRCGDNSSSWSSCTNNLESEEACLSKAEESSCGETLLVEFIEGCVCYDGDVLEQPDNVCAFEYPDFPMPSALLDTPPQFCKATFTEAFGLVAEGEVHDISYSSASFSVVNINYAFENGDGILDLEVDNDFDTNTPVHVDCPEERSQYLKVYKDVTLYLDEGLTEEACQLEKGQVYTARVSSTETRYLEGRIQWSIEGLSGECGDGLFHARADIVDDEARLPFNNVLGY